MDQMLKYPPVEEIARLVATVERLPMDDQVRILRIVDLLLLASPETRGQTQQMLHALLASGPGSKAECVNGVDDVILYLERSLAHGDAKPAVAATRH